MIIGKKCSNRIDREIIMQRLNLTEYCSGPHRKERGGDCEADAEAEGAGRRVRQRQRRQQQASNQVRSFWYFG